MADLRNDDAVLGGDGSALTVVRHRVRARASTIRAHGPQTGDQRGAQAGALLRTFTADSSGLVRCEHKTCELAWRLQPGSPLL